MTRIEYELKEREYLRYECDYCFFKKEIDSKLIECTHSYSTHYKHILSPEHPACEHFKRKRECFR